MGGRTGVVICDNVRFGGEAGTSAHPYANLIETHSGRQVLVINDMLGITRGKRPRFVRDFMAENAIGAPSFKASIDGCRRPHGRDGSPG